MNPFLRIAKDFFPYSLLFLAASFGLGLSEAVAREVVSYTVVIPKDLPLEKVQMFPAVERPGGRYSWPDVSKLKSEKEHGFVFPLKAGDRFEAVFYCPGYQFATVYDPAVAADERRVELAFQPLPTVVLKGKCPMRDPKEFGALKYRVEIYYYGRVGITHLKRHSGLELQFSIDEVPIAADGTFTVRVPDFFHDPLSAKDESRSLYFGVASTSAGHVTWEKKEVADRRALGLPDSSMIQDIGYVSYGLAPKGGGDFKIQPAYRGRQIFVEHDAPPIDGLR